MELTYDNYLQHYGVKGMKWGVRRDEAVLRRLTGDTTRIGVGGGTKAERKELRNVAKKDWKDYKKSTTRKERRQDASIAREQKMKYLLDAAVTDPKIMISTRLSLQQRPTLVMGETFVKHLSQGGMINVNMTELTDIRLETKE